MKKRRPEQQEEAVSRKWRADKTDTEETKLGKATSSQSSSRKLGKNTAAVRNRLCEPNQDRFCIKQFNVKEQCFNIIMAFSAVWDSVLFTLISGLFFLWIEFVQANPRGRGGNTAGSGSVGMFCFFLSLFFHPVGISQDLFGSKKRAIF